MSKKDLISAVAKETKLSKADVEKVVNGVFAYVVKSIKKGAFSLIGFGSFKKVKRKARTGRNPRTGEKLKIKAKNVVQFKAGKKLKDSIN